jgi:outer membrane immunogenic protein
MHTEKLLMKKLMLVSAALASLSIPAFAADLAVKAPGSPPFMWTSCFLGAHAGGGWARNDITDPVGLVEESAFGAPATGVTTAQVNPSGAVIGGQFGCDYQFAPNWVAGVEGSASGATMKGSTTVDLPDVGGAALVAARTDFIASAAGRLGYAVDRWLYYVRGGAAWAGGKYDVVGSGFGFEGLDTRGGWTVGAGIEWAFSRNWSARIEYNYYGFGTRGIQMTDSINGFGPAPVDVKESVQTVKLGVNFHLWSQ